MISKQIKKKRIMGNYEQLKSEVSNGTHPRTYNGVTCLAKKMLQFILSNNTL